MTMAVTYTSERLNYYRICFVVTDIMTEGMRTIFKQEWDKRYKTTLGEWKDSSKNGMDFFRLESERNRLKNCRILKAMVRGDTAEWDSVMLFHAILYSDAICDLNPIVRSNVDFLRHFRSCEFAHVPQGCLSDVRVSNVIAKVENAFTALGLDTNSIREIKNQTSFSTEELQRVCKKVDDLRLELEEKEKLLQAVMDERDSLQSQLLCDVSPFCTLPPPPSHEISPRDFEVAEIMEKLNRLKCANENTLTCLYLSGNPGSGKSQLARLAGKRFYEEVQESVASSFVMTLNAHNTKQLLASYISLARNCKCAEYTLTNIMNAEDLNTDEKISNLKTLISAKITHYNSWLLVVDDVTIGSNVHVHLPSAGDEQWARGQMLVTTQDTASIPLRSSSIEHISITKGMHPVDARLLLQQLSGIMDCEIAGEVARALDFQPLALAGAGIYVGDLRSVTKSFDWNDFLAKLNSGVRASTEMNLSKTNPSYGRSMTEAVTIAVRKAMASDTILKHVLIFLSVCAPRPLSVNVIVNYLMNMDDKCEDKDAITWKMKKSSLLLFHEAENGTYVRVHQIVHEAVKGFVKKSLPTDISESVRGALRAFCQVLGDSPMDDLLDNIVPHLEAIITEISILDLNFLNITPAIPHSSVTKCGKLCESKGRLVSAKRYFQLALSLTISREEMDEAKIKSLIASVDVHLGDFSEALSYYESALATFSKVFGPQHLEVAAACSCIGSVLQKMNEMPKALDYLLRALKIQQNALGPEHVEVARSYNTLGALFCALHDLTQAKEYHQRALAIYLKEEGPEHVDVATSYKELGNVFRATGDLEQAKEYIDRALYIRMKKLGPENVDVATCYNDLGLVCCELGDLIQAKEFFALAISIFHRKLGPDHNYSATLNSNLGFLHSKMGELYEAKKYYELAYDGFLKLRGPEHVSVANSARALAKVNCDLGNLQEAKRLYQSVLDIYLKSEGSEHPDVAQTYYNLGFVDNEMGEFERASESYKRALELGLKKLGPGHVDVATIYSGLGLVLHNMGDLRTAEMHFESALQIYLKTFDPENPKIASLYNNMAVLFRTTGDLEKAKDYHVKALAIRRKNFGNDSVQVATTLNDIALVHSEQGDFHQAKECYQCALSIYFAKLGRNHLKVAHVYSNLGSLNSELGDLQQAKECYESASHLYLKKLGPENDCVASSFNDLSLVYRQMGDLQQAKSYCDKALAIRRKKK